MMTLNMLKANSRRDMAFAKMRKLTEAERFHRKHSTPSVGCWNWAGSRDREGYGRFKGTLEVLAHRVAWQLANGAIPSGLYVLHQCDNTSCVRPDHLFLGTCADNVHDMQRKGRKPDQSGEAHPRARLSVADVLEIRRLRPGVTMVALARRFRVGVSTIGHIASGRAWKSVEG